MKSKYFEILKIIFTFVATIVTIRESGTPHTQQLPHASDAYVHGQVGTFVSYYLTFLKLLDY